MSTACNFNLTLSIGRPVFHMGLHLLQKHDLINCLKLDILKVMKFLGKFSVIRTATMFAMNFFYISCFKNLQF